MNEVQLGCEIVHNYAIAAERNITHFLSRMESSDGGYSPNCLSMIWLEDDAKALRALADRIDAERARLVGNAQLVSHSGDEPF